MTIQEFDEILGLLRSNFRSVDLALEKPEKAKSMADTWFRVLGGLDFGDAQAAIDEMLTDEKLQPARLAQFPARIRRLAGKASAQRHQKQVMARYGPGTSAGCPACKGDLWVHVAPWNDSTVRIASQEMDPAHGLVSLPCQCNPDPQWKTLYAAERHGPAFRWADLWSMADDHPARSPDALKMRQATKDAFWAAQSPKDRAQHERQKRELEARGRAFDARRKAGRGKAIIDGLAEGMAPDAARRKRWREGTKAGGAK